MQALDGVLPMVAPHADGKRGPHGKRGRTRFATIGALRMFSRKAGLRSAIVGLVALGISAGSAAAAVTLVNRDAKDHKLTIIEDDGAKTQDHVLKPTQVLEGICPKGCIIRLNDSAEDEYELEAGDKVSIEEGYLYYDDPETGPIGGAGTPGSATPSLPAAPPAQKK